LQKEWRSQKAEQLNQPKSAGVRTSATSTVLHEGVSIMYRAIPLFVFALALAFFVGSRGVADEAKKGDTHEGTVVSVTGDKLIMKTAAKDGQEATEHTHKIADNAKITCDGKACKVDDLKPGQKIRVTTKKGDKETAIKVEALDKNEKFGQRDR
jgi:hypothetical protein